MGGRLSVALCGPFFTFFVVGSGGSVMPIAAAKIATAFWTSSIGMGRVRRTGLQFFTGTGFHGGIDAGTSRIVSGFQSQTVPHSQRMVAGWDGKCGDRSAGVVAPRPAVSRPTNSILHRAG
jgi:hypothetical protein